MKLFLKGGTCIEVSDDEYVCVITKEKVGFSLLEQKREVKSYTKVGWINFEDFIVPRQYVERIEL